MMLECLKSLLTILISLCVPSVILASTKLPFSMTRLGDLRCKVK